MRLRATIAILLACAPFGPVTAAPGRPERLIVGWSSAMPGPGTTLFGERVILAGRSLRYVVVETTNPAAFLRLAAGDHRVRYVEPWGTMRTFDPPNDVLYPLQWEHQGPPGMDTQRAWAVTTGTSSVKVAVVDTGIDDSHPDLSGRVVEREVVCDSCAPGDQLGHGTSVAGVVAATAGNLVGTAGAAQVSLIDVEVVAADGAAFTDVADGIAAAADLGADIVNLSLGCELPCYSAVVHDALVYAASKGALSICAAGNASGGVGYPAYDSYCMAVSAIDTDGSLATFSNSGPTIEIGAPGVDIYTTAINGFTIAAGTSVAAPQVSGIGALVLSKTPSMSAVALRAHLTATATPTSLPASKVGAGWVNACKALGASECEPATGLLPRTRIESYVAAGGVSPPLPIGPIGCGPIATLIATPQLPQSANLGGACLGIYGPETSVHVELIDVHSLPVAAGYAFLHVDAFGESGVAAGPICGSATLSVPSGANQLRIWVVAPPGLPTCALAPAIPGVAGEIRTTWS